MASTDSTTQDASKTLQSEITKARKEYSAAVQAAKNVRDTKIAASYAKFAQANA